MSTLVGHHQSDKKCPISRWRTGKLIPCHKRTQHAALGAQANTASKIPSVFNEIKLTNATKDQSVIGFVATSDEYTVATKSSLDKPNAPSSDLHDTIVCVRHPGTDESCMMTFDGKWHIAYVNTQTGERHSFEFAGDAAHIPEGTEVKEFAKIQPFVQKANEAVAGAMDKKSTQGLGGNAHNDKSPTDPEAPVIRGLEALKNLDTVATRAASMVASVPTSILLAKAPQRCCRRK